MYHIWYNNIEKKTCVLGGSKTGTGYLATYNEKELITGFFGTGPNKEGIIGLHDDNNLGWSASGRNNQ